MASRGRPALSALVVILALTAGWWALALWPMETTAPEWLSRTRYVCFGATRNGLPDAGGWVLLVGQPLGMLIMLVAAWGQDLRAALGQLMERALGQITAGVVAAGILAGVLGVFVRVRDSQAEPFVASPEAAIADQLTRVNDAPPSFALVDQFGDTVTLERYQGRPVLVTFAFAHCETVCPLVVYDVLMARERLAESNPAVLVITLDPWRDPPSRLPAIAKQWGMSGDAHILSGAPDDVERALSKWRVPRVRNERTGDISHPTIVYVISPAGRITYVLNGGLEQIVAAVGAL